LTNAKRFIATNISLHIIEIILFVFLLTDKKITTIDFESILVLVAIYLLTMFFVTIVFSKGVLAKSINKYNNSTLTKYARIIGLSYLFLNFILASIIFVLQSKQT